MVAKGSWQVHRRGREVVRKWQGSGKKVVRLRQVKTGCNTAVMTVVSECYQWWVHPRGDKLGR